MDFSLFLTDIRDNAGLTEEETDLLLSDNFIKLMKKVKRTATDRII